MSIDYDITAHLDSPNLSAVKVVAAVRGISVHDARIALLTEWDQRLSDAIDAENNQAEMWAGMATDVASTDPDGALGFVDAARECLAVSAQYSELRGKAAHMIRAALEHQD